MLRILLAAILFVGLTGAARAQDSAGAIQGVITAQIDAFKRDDFATAFTFASPMIKGMFRTPENFGRMVRQGYPMVWRPDEVQFRELERRGAGPVQRVLIRDGDGVFHVLEYRMIETEDGWQINGVSLIMPPAVGA